MADTRRLYRAKNQNISILENPSNNKFAVRGTQGDIYSVDLTGPSCDCPDWQKRSPEDGCKHILKVKIELGIVEPSNGGQLSERSQNFTEYDPIEGINSRNRATNTTNSRIESNTDATSEVSTTTSESDQNGGSDDSLGSEASDSIAEQDGSRSHSSGPSYVWTERDQVDDDQICVECNTINDPDSTECRDCGATMLTAEEAGFDDVVEDTVDDDPIADNISTREPDPDVVVEQKKHNVVDALYGELKAIKAGFWKFAESVTIVGMWIGGTYLLYKFAMYTGFTDVPYLVAGELLVTFLVMWGYGIEETDGWVFTAE